MRLFLAAPLLLILELPAQAVIMRLTPLAEVLESEQFIFVAALESADPKKPSATFRLDRSLKGEAPFTRIPVNMTGDDEARKAGDTQIILDRLDASRKVVFFVSKRGKKYNTMACVEGSWFALQGTIDDADKSVRWAFLHGEPYLRRTFTGTSAELIAVIESGLAKKAKPPAPNEKEKPGYGPAVEKKQSPYGRIPAVNAAPALFAVIPSFVLVGPLAIIAALFPGVFARMAIGMKRWRAFLVVASINGTLALIYWLIQMYWPTSGWWFGLQAFTIYLMAVTAVGLSWAGRRYRRMAVEEPGITAVPSRTELYSLGGLTAFAGLSVVLTGVFATWRTNLDLPMREFTFIGIALAVAMLYAGYRKITAKVDGPAPDRRLSLSGESVGLGVLLLCGFASVLGSGAPAPVAAVTGGETGDADAIGPRLIGEVRVFEVKGASQVMSNIAIAGDRLYFGTAKPVRITSRDGALVCLDANTGEVKWFFDGEAEDMLPVFCTPTVIDGRIYCGEGMHEDKDCRLFCLDTADKKPLWEKPFQTKSHTEGAPAVAGGKVFFPAGDDGLFAADAKTGAKLWQFPGGKDRGIHIDAAPAASGNRVFAGSGLYSYVALALDAGTGSELWRTDLKLRSFGAPTVIGKYVYYGVGTGNMGADVFDYPEESGTHEEQPAGAVVCLDAETGKQVWRQDLPRSVHTGLAGDAFSIYAASRDGFIYAFDRMTGKLRWKRGANGPSLTSGPAVATAAGLPVAVYAVSQDGNVLCLNPQTGAVLWEKRLPDYHWSPLEKNDVLCAPAIITTATPTGSKRAIFIGAMTIDPSNPAKKTAAIFRFEDEIGGA